MTRSITPTLHCDESGQFGRIEFNEIESALIRCELSDHIQPNARDCLQAIEEPGWQFACSWHDWRKHIDPSIRNLWPQLSWETRIALFKTAVEMSHDARNGL